MKVKRLKRASRVITFYRYNFGFFPPHSVLLDGTFCQAALQNKINLREQMPKYLADPVEMFTTECVLNELEQLGKPLHGALVIAQQFRVAKCPHRPKRTAAECVAHLARRSRTEGHIKYFVATQDDGLLGKLRELGGVPLMSIRFNTILLEKPSEQSTLLAESHGQTSELQKVRQLRQELLGPGEEKRHRKRKAKGPNPLSCKKKKAKSVDSKVPGAFGKQKTGENDEEKQKKSAENGKKQRRVRKRLLGKSDKNADQPMIVDSDN